MVKVTNNMINLFYILENTCNSSNHACKNVVGTEGIPGDIVSIIYYVYIGIKVVVPIILILFGMIELGKALTSQKEDEIKKAQSSFFKKLILAVIIFLVFSIVDFVFHFAGGDGNVWGCVEQIINAKCS